ncbi:hypothetical protein BDZ91DRAFT_761143 [Kalaharituber pfeilii]|nr:hypothetical protein BDZ91DRAFT_761143 [Kalaharituber pfeilii]
MGKKDKKKSADKKARVAEKAQKKAAAKEKKSTKKNANDVDPDDVDIDTVLAEYARQQALYHKVTETVLPAPPPPRANATLTPSPGNTAELILFGGEMFNGALATFYNNLFVYNLNRNEWKQVTSPNSPLPRSGHWMCASGGKSGVGTGKGAIWLFGGEFSSPKQGTFYHYGDFWRLDCEVRGGLEWEKIESKGGGRTGGNPPSRSGHRMVAWKQYIVLFGGFQDTSSTTKYLNDLWLFDTTTYTWHPVVLPAHAQRPDPRSSFSFLPHEAGAVLYGGYSRIKASSAVGTGSSNSRHQMATKPVVHQDTWLLRISPSNPMTQTRWERRKRPTNSPNPPRVGVTMAGHKGRGIMFGGVHDTEKDEEGLESQFFDNLLAWGVERNRFFELTLRKPKGVGGRNAGAADKRQAGGGGGGRRDRAKEDAEELLRNLARLEASSGLTPTTDLGGDKDSDTEPEAPAPQTEFEVSFTMPHPRFNAALAVQEDTLYIYGGTFEKGDREFTFDEMYKVDLVKLDGIRTIFARKDEIAWVEEEEDEGEEEEDEEEEEEEEDEDEEGAEVDEKAAEIERKKAEGQEKKRRAQEEAAAAAAAAAEAELESAPVQEDTAPFPRPFESLREFFARTSQIWQETILANAAAAAAAEGGVDTTAGQGKTVKELRKAAFAAAEERWWAVREEVRALEDEQEEAGIGEVVNLKEKEGTGVGELEWGCGEEEGNLPESNHTTPEDVSLGTHPVASFVTPNAARIAARVFSPQLISSHRPFHPFHSLNYSYHAFNPHRRHHHSPPYPTPISVMSDFTPCLTYAALPLTLPFLLLFAGWSWLEREGKRMEKEAEGLRAVRSRIVAECGDDDEDSDGKRNGFGKGDGG